MKKLTNDQIAKIFGCTPQQVAAQFAKNAAQLGAMRGAAEKTGRKVRGFTADQLRIMEATAIAGSCES